MSRERLEEIQHSLLAIDKSGLVDREKLLDYRHWAFELLKIGNEQAERTQELEEIAETDGSAFHTLEKLFIESEQQNKRYREALEFYADEESWSLYDHHGKTFIGIDGGMRARKVLEESE